MKQIKAGLPVFFGCDVGQFSDRIRGIMDTKVLMKPGDIATLTRVEDAMRSG